MTDLSDELDEALDGLVADFNRTQQEQRELFTTIAGLSRPAFGADFGALCVKPEHLDVEATGPHPTDTLNRIAEAFPNVELRP